LAVRFRLQVETELEQLEGVLPAQKTEPHWTIVILGGWNIFSHWDLWLELSIWVVIVWQYNIYVKHAHLDALSAAFLKLVIRSLFVALLRKMLRFRHNFPTTQRKAIGSQIREWEVKDHLKLHLLHIYYFVIWSQLKYLIGVKDLSLWNLGSAV
jgi:hypothetical protein